VADENIPCVPELFGRFGKVRQLAGRDLYIHNLRDADVLLVRSVTAVNRALLHGSSVKFVGSATIGTDHIDLPYLTESDIAFAHAPGSNADAVADYVTAAVFRLAVRRGEVLQNKVVGIVGAGEIGGRLARRFTAMGNRVLLNDPPLEAARQTEGQGHDYLTLDKVLKEADIVSVHVPLVYDRPHPTFHLLDEYRLGRLKRGSWFVNTSRGSVVDNNALVKCLRDRAAPAAVVLDVWEHEPEPDPELVRRVDLATPHIAGYALDAKIRGAKQLYEAFRQYIGNKDREDEGSVTSGRTLSHARAVSFADECTDCHPVKTGVPDPILPQTDWLDMFVRHMYDIEADDDAMRGIAGCKDTDGPGFSLLRRNYPMRREFAAHFVPRSMVPVDRQHVVEQAIGVRLQ